MAKTNINSKQGFTIIEVVLVLAIAGLIFLMVFIALPALQRSQRDTQRRDDYGMLSAAITSYSASNGGKLTNLYGTSACKTLDASKYINETGNDPDGIPYILKGCSMTQFSGTAGNYVPNAQEVFVVIGADCSSNGSGSGSTAKTYDYNVPTPKNSTRAFAIFGYLESGSQTYCSASQ